MENLYDFFCVADEYTEYLKGKGFRFSPKGCPLFSQDMFLKETPEIMVPVGQRKNRRVVDKKKTVLVFFCADELIYRRLDKLLAEVDIYKEYMGVVEPDITVTKDMDLEWQFATMLLNQLAMAVLAINGVKVILNTRVGTERTFELLENLPKGVMIASGFLGGTSKYKKYDYMYIAKILRLMPKKVLIYGSCSKKTLEKLDMVGIDYKIYPDFRKMCKEVA